MSDKIPPIVEHLGDSDLLITYRPDYDDVTIEEDAFTFSMERDEFEALKLFLNKLPAAILLFASIAFSSAHAADTAVGLPEDKIVDEIGVPDKRVEVAEKIYYVFESCRNAAIPIGGMLYGTALCEVRTLTVENGTVTDDKTEKKRVRRQRGR